MVGPTTEPTEYPHPNNPMISFVDLPGIGTPNYPDLPTYCEKVCFERYDTFLIFTANRFRQNGKAIKEADILEKIRENCIQDVKDLISSEKEIFLISNYHKDKWDFDRLIAGISNALPVLQRKCLTLSLSNLTRECLKRKAKFFKAQAGAVAAISAATGAILIPGVGGAIVVALIGGTIAVYYRQFGFNNTTPEELDVLDKKYREIIETYQFTAGSISFAFTLRYLLRSINELEEVAMTVWDNAAKRSVRDGTDNSQPQRYDE
ncbi:interferon-inducible GTPase 5-like [Paramuricea clavata]|uniref:Interferon-inducible GTPase 5-like n=1 Tax=Paramuricea clavata TaxID=317549 RepID=A0A6S7JUF0_PARCT|nr:interferon-inducible GTPase 5-like [Paramuricea clavata]